MNQKQPIAKLAGIQLGYQFRSKPEGDENGNVSLIQIKDILPDRSGIRPGTALRFKPERDASKALLKEGDVLFMGKGTTPFACIVRELTRPAVAGGMFYILRPDTRRILPDYLAWVLNDKRTLKTLQIASGTGVAMPVIKRKELEQLAIPLPPIKAQQRIGELQELSRQEIALMSELSEQKQKLAEAVCRTLMEGDMQ
jgi:hypothetical protein